MLFREASLPATGGGGYLLSVWRPMHLAATVCLLLPAPPSPRRAES